MGIKVITPPAALLTIAELHLQLKLDTGAFVVHPDDTLLTTRLLPAAAAYCEHASNRSYGSQTLELALDAFPSGPIALPRGPVTSVTSVTYVDTAQATQTRSSSLYTLDDYSPEAWLIPAYDTTWPDVLATPNAVKVRYVAGAATVPPSVLSAMLLLVEYWHDNMGAYGVGTMSEDVRRGIDALLQIDRDYSRVGGA